MSTPPATKPAAGFDKRDANNPPATTAAAAATSDGARSAISLLPKARDQTFVPSR